MYEYRFFQMQVMWYSAFVLSPVPGVFTCLNRALCGVMFNRNTAEFTSEMFA